MWMVERQHTPESPSVSKQLPPKIPDKNPDRLFRMWMVERQHTPESPSVSKQAPPIQR
jgi:hypothetical protein